MSQQLTPRENLFVLAYTTPGSDTFNKKGESAKAAGYKSHNNKATELLAKSHIQLAIQGQKDKLAGKFDVKAEDVIKELTAIGFSNIKDFLTVDENGDVHIKDFAGIDEYKLRAVESVKVNMTEGKDGKRKYTTVQFKFHNKLIAIDQLNKYLGLYKEEQKQRVEQVELTDAMKKEAERISVLLLKENLSPEPQEVPLGV